MSTVKNKGNMTHKCFEIKKWLVMVFCALLCFTGTQAQNLAVSVAKFHGDKRAAVCLTFDDGLAEHYTIVAPELDKRNMRGTFGVCGALINADSAHIVKADRMTWPQLKDLVQRGHEVSNHGWRHRNHGRFPLDTIRYDIQHNDSMIFFHTGVKPMTFFYPNNTKRKEPMRLAEQGRVGTRTFQISAGSKRTQEWFEKWVAALIDTCGWGVTMTHGITYGYDAFKDAGRLTRFLDLLESKEASLWIGCLKDVMAYTKERDDVTLGVKRRKRSMKIKPKMTLDSSVFTHPLTMVVRMEDGTSHISASQDGKSLDVTATPDGRFVFDFNPFGGEIKVRLK